jgi:hypothetical protein
MPFSVQPYDDVDPVDVLVDLRLLTFCNSVGAVCFDSRLPCLPHGRRDVAGGWRCPRSGQYSSTILASATPRGARGQPS